MVPTVVGRTVLACLVCGVSAAATASAQPNVKVAALAPVQIQENAGQAHTLDLVKNAVLTPTGEGRTLDIGYDIRMGGLTLMSIDMKAAMEKGHYVATTYVATKGLADLFASSNVQALATGEVNGKTIVPRTYNSDIQDPKKRQLVGLTFAEQGPIAVDAQPAYDNRFPVPEELKKSTVDPVSGLLLVALGQSASPNAPCGVNIPIYDGRRRYDIKLSFQGNEKVSVKNAYEGPALHCVAQYERVAGFKPPKRGKKPTQIPPIDVWLAPLEDGTMLVPVRMQVDSDFGGIVAKATRLSVGGRANQG